MTPNERLKNLQTLNAQLGADIVSVRNKQIEAADIVAKAERLTFLVQDMDEYLIWGGELPEPWKPRTR